MATADTPFEIRVLDESRYREAHDLFLSTLHHPPVDAEKWTRVLRSFEPGRVLGAIGDDEVIGTVSSWASRLAVPGGTLPMAAVSRVGVRPDRTRRGVLGALVREQFRLAREAGDVTATLRATEGVIYGRFGYGVATRGRDLKVDRRRAVVHADAPLGGRVRLVARDEVEQVTRAVHERRGPVRPGEITPWPGWWALNAGDAAVAKENVRVVVHTGDDGRDDGFVFYKVERAPHGDRSTLRVRYLYAPDPAAWAGLWRYLLSVDLVDEVVVHLAPLDEPLQWLLTDPRAVSVTGSEDETWLRLLDVPAALAARSFAAAEPVVLRVHDAFLPENSGAYRVTPDGAARTDAPAALTVAADVLASAYLGDVTFSALAAAGRVGVVDPAALPHADRLFAVPGSPWCGTYF
ncbi:GNAT family N-acetyltransferase [Umezawaea beigongshangensis]|uniref:GNAT family N-acetyltransferase n=1 Tax=Umezawaea beigongshangensis TaxID=2780383 RepID=UPI0018F10B97|nr:GNAT family N-acetyltransferase [Umezawaea beigongshangensis]